MNGVQVRGIYESQARRDGRRDLLTADLRQRVLAERLHVLGVGHQDRCPGGGSQHPGVRDLLAEYGVDKRRLSSTCGTADHHDGWDISVLEAGDHLITYLSDEAVTQCARSLNTVGTQGQIKALEVPHQVSEDIEKLSATQRGDGSIVLGVARGGRNGHVPTL